MECVWHYLGLYLGLELVDICSGYPLAPSTLAGGATPDVTTWVSVSPLVSAVLLASSVLLVFGCLCCRRTKGFQEFTDSGSTPNLSTPGGGYVNNAASPEFPLFPPPQPTNQAVRFEPLPEIVPPNRTKKPAAFNNAVSHGLSEQDWFAEGPGVDFPRQQLQYVREAGRGWFGRVVEGNAQHIVSTATTTPVVVKILRDDASPTDQMYFLHEVRAYRDLVHPNVLRMIGRCLETDPFLVLLEACPTGDLKSFLCQNISTARALSDEGVTLNMACNIAAGLEHMLENGFVHTDLAARNCLVTPDLTVKIGDYGHSIESFKEDYYIAGDVALPVRWCAPETVYCTDTTIQTKEVTPAANVWNLGVVLWEISEFGKLPYGELTDDEVVGQVFGEANKRLPLPSLPAPHRDNLYLLMKLCWSTVEDRPALKQVHSMLQHLNSSRHLHQIDGQDSSLRTEDDFNRRWQTFKPNTIPKRDDHNLSLPDTAAVIHEPPPSDQQEPSLPTVEQASDVPKSINIPVVETVTTINERQAAIRSPLHLALDDHNNQLSVQSVAQGNQDGLDRITPSTISPQLSLASSFGGEFFSNTIQTKDRSASLQNLRGSLDDLSDSVGPWDEGRRRERKSEDGESGPSRVKRDLRQTKEEGDSSLSSRGEPDFDSWLKGVETTDEEEAKFVAKISEAIRDLDDALALEKTSSSSSSSEASSKQQTPVKEFRSSDQNGVLDFRLGGSSSSDTEEETWRGRIERGEFSERVKAKSKSVADLMVLTHIEPSDGSDSEPPSLTWSFERGSHRTSFNNNNNPSRPARSISMVSTSVGSEGNIHKAVLGQEFLESLQKIQHARRDSNKNLLSEVASFLEREKMHQDSIMPLRQSGIEFLPTNHNRETNFLAFDASGKPPIVKESILNINPPILPDTVANKELVLNVSKESTPNTNVIKQENTPDSFASHELILNINKPILLESITTQILVQSLPQPSARKELVENVNSAYIDNVNSNSVPVPSVKVNSQVPEIKLVENTVGSLSDDIETKVIDVPETKLELSDLSNCASSVEESEVRPSVPDILIEAPCSDTCEEDDVELFARKPVPLPRRTIRFVCKDASDDLDVRSPKNVEPSSEPNNSPDSPSPSTAFVTSTPCAPKAAPRLTATTEVLPCNVSEITLDFDGEKSTNLSNCSGLSWDDTSVSLIGNQIEQPLTEKHTETTPYHDVEITEAINRHKDASSSKNTNLESFKPSTGHLNNFGQIPDLLEESIPVQTMSNVAESIATINREPTSNLASPSHDVTKPSEHSQVDSIKETVQESLPAFVVQGLKNQENVSTDLELALEHSANSLQNGFKETSTSPSSSCDDWCKDDDKNASTDHSRDLESEVVETMHTSSVPLETSKLVQSRSFGNTSDVKGTEPLLENLLEATEASPKFAVTVEADGFQCKNESRISTQFDLNQPLLEGQTLIHNYIENSEPKSMLIMNDAISDAFIDVSKRDLGGSHNLSSQFAAGDRFYLGKESSEEMSLSVSGEKDQARDTLSSVILGPCEDFTLDYFKGLKTTFPDSAPQAFHLQFDPEENSYMAHGGSIHKNKSSESGDTNIDYSINGWDDFLGKTLENQDVSKYEDVTFPSLVIEHCPTSTAKNIENIFESITDLHRDVIPVSTAVQDLKPSTVVVNYVSPDLGEIMKEKLEVVSSDVSSQLEEKSEGTMDELSRLGVISDQLSKSDLDTGLDNVDKVHEHIELGNSSEVSFLKTRESFEEITERGSNEDAIRGFHLNVESSDGLREIEEDTDEFAEFALDVKHCTPDDERSSDSGFRDKGSLSESCEDACDEKYNLEDIEAELEETFNQGGFNYKLEDEETEAFNQHERFGSPEASEINGGLTKSKVAENLDEVVLNHTEGCDYKSSPVAFGRVEQSNDLLASNVSQTSSASFPMADKSLDSNSTSVHKPLEVGQYLDDNLMPSSYSEDKCARVTPVHVDLDTHNVVSNNMFKEIKDMPCDNMNGRYTEGTKGNFAERFVSECIDFEEDVEFTTTNAADTKNEMSSMQTVDNESPVKKGGWYLHPPDGSQTETLDDFLSPKSESSTSSLASKHDDSENSYVSYHLDEEYVTAIRNELRDKLPCANQNVDSDSEDDMMDEEEGGEDRQDIMIHYNLYPAPLSPILEERESMSSLDYSPYVNSFNFDSDPESMVFSLDSQEEVRKESEAKKFEEDIREALENVSYESSSSSDRDPNTTVLLEELDNDVKRKVLKVKGTSAEAEDDVLFVDTVTNEVRLVESPIPKLQLAFVNKRSIDQAPILMTPDFLKDEESVAVNSGTFTISKSKFDDDSIESSETSPALSVPEPVLHTEADEHVGEPSHHKSGGVLNIDLVQMTTMIHTDNLTPDSVSPITASDGTVPSTDTEEVSEFYLTPPSESSPVRRLPYPTPNLLQCDVTHRDVTQETLTEPIFDTVKDISLNFANNEAAEIINDLEDCGILSSPKSTEDVLHLMTGEIYEYQDSTESSEEKYSPRSLEDDFEEMISFEEYSQSSESREYNAPTPESQMSLEFALSKPDFTSEMSPVQRLDFLTAAIGIVKESNDDRNDKDSFDDELERTLKLNDLGSLLKLNSDSLREGKSFPSPSINPSAKEIIVNFVKSNEQNLGLLSKNNHHEESTKPIRSELPQLNGDFNNSESSNQDTLNHGDKYKSVVKTNKDNDLSSESFSSNCKLESSQNITNVASEIPSVTQHAQCYQAETKEKIIETVSKVEAVHEDLATENLEKLALKEENNVCSVVTDGKVESSLNSDAITETVSKLLSESTIIQSDISDRDNSEHISDSTADPNGRSEIKNDTKFASVSEEDKNEPSVAQHTVKLELCEESVDKRAIEEENTASGVQFTSAEDCSIQSLAQNVVFLEGPKQEASRRYVVNNEVVDPEDITLDLHVLESNLEDWSKFVGSKAPMPSPEEESWRKLSSSMLARGRVLDLSSSMLGFSDTKASPDGDSSGDSKNSPLGEVLFDPDTPTSMLGFSEDKGSRTGGSAYKGLGCDDDNGSRTPESGYKGLGFSEDGEMSTSFSAPGEEEEEDYAPDWESDSEGSSSSGEFVWREGERERERESSIRDLPTQVHTHSRYLGKPYECLPEFPMEVIAEEDEDEEDDDDDDDDDEDSSQGSGTEFVPSAWDSQATPSRSALRSPDKKTDGKKNVWFKKQKYHCVYEYPRENSDTESEANEVADSHPWRPRAGSSDQAWRPPASDTPTQAPSAWQPPVVDYASYADWEVTDDGGDGTEPDTESESDNNPVVSTKPEPFDFYKLSNVDYDFSTGVISEDGEFFISSSARPFQQFNATPSSLFGHSSSEFFPGQSLDQSQASAGFAAVVDSFGDEIDTSPRNIAGSKTGTLALDTLEAASEEVCDVLCDVHEELEDLVTDKNVVNDTVIAIEKEVNEIVSPSLKSSAEKVPKTDSSERDFSDCSQTPPSPLSPTGLGELRHTRDKLKLNLPSTNAGFLLDAPTKWGRGLEPGEDATFLLDAPGKRGRTIAERGEASLLDSGEDTEDSGIESSNGMSATLTLKTTLEENLNSALTNAH